MREYENISINMKIFWGGILVYKFEKIENFLSYVQSLDIQEYVLKRIF